MNFKSIIALGLGVATLGLSVPAFADSVTVVSNGRGPVREPVLVEDTNYAHPNGQKPAVADDTGYIHPNDRTKVSGYRHGNRDRSGIDASTKKQVDVSLDKMEHQPSTKVREWPVKNR